MDIFTIVIEIVFLVFLLINHILNKKMFKMMDEILEQNEDLIIRNINLMKKEVELKNILDEAKATNEFAVLTVNKIKELFMTSNQDK